MRRFLVSEYLIVFEIDLLKLASFQSTIIDSSSQPVRSPTAWERHAFHAPVWHLENYLTNWLCRRPAFLIRVRLSQKLMLAAERRHHHLRGLICLHCLVVKGTHLRWSMATLNTVECSLETSESCSYQLLIELPQVRVAVPADLIQEWGVASKCP